MIAKIIEKDRREYYSTVFALCDNGWDTVAVVFDEKQDKFSFIKMYHFTRDITRSVFIVDCDESDFEKEQNIKINLFKTLKNVRGYDWLVNDRKLFLNIINNKEVDECYKDKAKALNAKIEQNEWTFVRNEKDVENLMSVAWGFHDGIIEKITYNNKDNIEVVFSGCWGSKITLIFQANPKAHVSFDDEYCYYVMSSNIFFEDGFVYWVEENQINSTEELNKYPSVNYFRARALKWKQESEYHERR